MSSQRKTSSGFTPNDGHLFWRDLFLDFFESKGCKQIASDSLVPENDPSLLFTGAGMNQFKDDFTGVLNHDTRRATTCQKCLRMPDLENVGKTQRHHTFFEMMGFFSFGDYFKKEAIAWAWEFYTSEAWCGIDIEKIRVSVYQDDDEAYDLWKTQVPHLHERSWIYRLGEHDNFWPAGAPSEGPNGVCGPCSELFYDLGEQHNIPELKGADNPENNGDRFMELGNIVFTQFSRSGPIPGEGTLTPLPQKNIDFGGGFERLVMVKDGAPTTLDSSLFMPIRYAIREAAGAIAADRIEQSEAITPYQQAVREDELMMSAPGGVRREPSFKAEDMVREKRIADHLRASVFIIGDGVVPGSDKQGYVLRRVIRRAYRDGIKLGFDGPFLHKLAPVLIEDYAKARDYGNLETHRQLIIDTIQREEEEFDRVLSKGMEKLGHEMKLLDDKGKHELTGTVAFDLHSTYGLPVDVTRDVLAEHGLRLDEDGFEKAFAEFREKSRKTSVFEGDIFDQGSLSKTKRLTKPTEFVGYDRTEFEGRVVTIALKAGDKSVSELGEGDEAVIVLNRTPFYGESGGQVGDAGVIEGPDGVFEVTDTMKTSGYHLHVGVMKSGTMQTGQDIQAKVDGIRRKQVVLNHSATHLMHSALREVLGEHVQQRGSLVAPDRLRFDFSHPSKVTDEEIAAIERRVNQWIRENHEVQVANTTPDAAKEAGALMFFGEKYGDEVRMLTMGPVSCELCGGTHASRTGDIGQFRIISESSVSSGVRRIEAVTGAAAVEVSQQEHEALSGISATLKVPAEKLVERIGALLKEVKELKSAKPAAQAADAASLASKIEELAGHRAIITLVPGAAMNDLLTTKDALMQDGGLDVALLAGDGMGKPALLLALSQPLVGKGVDAGPLLREIAAIVEGRGGGKKHLAQAGGKDVSKLPQALEKGREILTQALTEVVNS